MIEALIASAERRDILRYDGSTRFMPAMWRPFGSSSLIAPTAHPVAEARVGERMTKVIDPECHVTVQLSAWSHIAACPAVFSVGGGDKRCIGVLAAGGGREGLPARAAAFVMPAHEKL